jgi:hypothetical protein
MLISARQLLARFYLPTDLPAGGNPSAEETEEALEDGATQVNNVIHSFRLQPTQFDKKSYLAYLKVRHWLHSMILVYGCDLSPCLYDAGIHESGQK